MKLEAAADGVDPANGPDAEITEKGTQMELNLQNTLIYLINNRNILKKSSLMAYSQKYLVSGFAEMAIRAAQDRGINNVAISGGVLANEYISTKILEKISNNHLVVLLNEKNPVGDGGAALGQACIALYSDL